jgi:hypothetical protein
LVSKNDLWGSIDISGKIIVPCKYEKLTRSGDRYFATLKGEMAMLGSIGNALRLLNMTGSLPAADRSSVIKTTWQA